MLYDYLQILLPVITFVVGMYTGYKIYAIGFKDGKRNEGKNIPSIMPKPVLFRNANKAPVKNNPYYDDVLANIEAYDGTSQGQREVRTK